jgi:beta-glucosidase/6-phospho-beta-glucosidase/beta-galactosidase
LKNPSPMPLGPATAVRLVGQPNLFRSFWLAGFEAANHINSHGIRLDLMAGTQHDRQVDGDYALIRSFNMRAARDAVRWHLIDHQGHYDFSSWLPMLQAALRHGIQVIWTLCHYGWPEELDVFSTQFVDRFARYAGAVARVHADHTDEVPFFTSINEMSFMAWAIGHRGYMFPYAVGRSGELKRQFLRASLAACDAIWAVDRRARFVQGEPLIHVVPPRDRPDLADAAARQRASQFEVWDLLAGRQGPELGGAERYLDIIAVHYYHANQWETPEHRLRWEDVPRDERWVPLHLLLKELYERYKRPFFIGETSHFGVGRAPWLREIAAEVKRALNLNIPVSGICLYPILDRYDWEDSTHWHHSGLWELEPDSKGNYRRVLNEPYAAALRDAQQLLPSQ